MTPVIPFQDRGHGTATERRTMTFFISCLWLEWRGEGAREVQFEFGVDGRRDGRQQYDQLRSEIEVNLAVFAAATDEIATRGDA